VAAARRRNAAKLRASRIPLPQECIASRGTRAVDRFKKLIRSER
jgi:hypothetical protein